MLIVLTKWRVTVTFIDVDVCQIVTYYLHENHIGNVLKRASEIDFGRDVSSINVMRCRDASPQTVTATAAGIAVDED